MILGGTQENIFYLKVVCLRKTLAHQNHDLIYTILTRSLSKKY